MSRRFVTPGLVLSLLVFPLPAAPPAQNPGAEDMLWTKAIGHRLPSQLTRSQVQEDIALLRYALEHAYGGRRFVPAGDYAETQAELAGLSDGAPLDPQALCDVVADALRRLPDNHLSIQARDRSCGQAREQRRSPRVGKNVAAGSPGSKAWSLTAVQAGGQNIAVLSLTSFPPPEDGAWAGYSEAVQGLLSSPAVIVDLRGNRGGADARGIELARVLLGRNPPPFFDAVVQRQTPGSIALQLNSARLERYVLGLRGEAVPGYLEETIGTLEENFRDALEGRLPAENVWEGAAKPEEDAPPAYERVGIEPDVPVPPDRDALDTALDWLSRQRVP